MNKMQAQLEEFHFAMGQPIGEFSEPKIQTKLLRYDLIAEESKELLQAIQQEDIVEIIDGMCDLIYVVIGTAVAFGIDLEPFFNEVHRTNMLKASGPVHPSGKRLKPEGWTPPVIAEILEQQKRRLSASAPL